MFYIVGMPYGITLDQINVVKDLVEEFPHTKEAFSMIFKEGDLAPKTVTSYSWVLKDLKTFCLVHKQGYPELSPKTIMFFLTHCVLRQRTFSFYKKVIPAIKNMEKLLGLEISGITQLIRTTVACLKRLSAKFRNPLKKAKPFNRSHLKKMIDVVILEPLDKNITIDLIDFRSVIRSVIVFYSWMRFSDYEIITDSMVEDCGDYIKINLPRSKQDQFYSGTCSYIATYEDRYCPVVLIRLYFSMFQLKFNYQGSNLRFLNCRVQRKGNRHFPLLHTSICYTTGVAYTRELLTRLGFKGNLYTETSFKSGGVSEFLNAGNTLESAMINGRWRHEKTSLFYRREDPKYRVKLTKKIPSIGDA